mgnify:CR=1 FL=1
MAAKKNPSTAIFKAMKEKSDLSKEAALRELRALSKDIAALEQILTGKKKKGNFSLFDVIHGAFEIFRNASVVFETELLAGDMEKSMGGALAEEFLEKHGATLLKKPAGWHWISAQGEMHFLGKADEAEKAAEKLGDLVSGPKRGKKASKKTDAQTEAPAGDEEMAEGELGT